MKDSESKSQMKKLLQELLEHEKIEAEDHKQADEELKKALQLLF
jgi:hypothetical protein